MGWHRMTKRDFILYEGLNPLNAKRFIFGAL